MTYNANPSDDHLAKHRLGDADRHRYIASNLVQYLHGRQICVQALWRFFLWTHYQAMHLRMRRATPFMYFDLWELRSRTKHWLAIPQGIFNVSL